MNKFCSLALSDLRRAKHMRRSYELSERDHQHSASITHITNTLQAFIHLICITPQESLTIIPIQQTETLKLRSLCHSHGCAIPKAGLQVCLAMSASTTSLCFSRLQLLSPSLLARSVCWGRSVKGKEESLKRKLSRRAGARPEGKQGLLGEESY